MPVATPLAAVNCADVLKDPACISPVKAPDDAVSAPEVLMLAEDRAPDRDTAAPFSEPEISTEPAVRVPKLRTLPAVNWPVEVRCDVVITAVTSRFPAVNVAALRTPLTAVSAPVLTCPDVNKFVMAADPAVRLPVALTAAIVSPPDAEMSLPVSNPVTDNVFVVSAPLFATDVAVTGPVMTCKELTKVAVSGPFKVKLPADTEPDATMELPAVRLLVTLRPAACMVLVITTPFAVIVPALNMKELADTDPDALTLTADTEVILACEP